MAFFAIMIFSKSEVIAQHSSEIMTIVDVRSIIPSGATIFGPVKSKTVITGDIDTLMYIGVTINENQYYHGYLDELVIVSNHKFQYLDPNLFEWIKLVRLSNVTGLPNLSIDSVWHPTTEVRFSNSAQALPAREQMVLVVIYKVRQNHDILRTWHTGFFSVKKLVMRRPNGELLRNQFLPERQFELKRSFVPTDTSEHPRIGAYYVSSPNGDRWMFVRRVDSIYTIPDSQKVAGTWENGGVISAGQIEKLTNAHRVTKLVFGDSIQFGGRTLTHPFVYNDVVWYETVRDSMTPTSMLIKIYSQGHARVVNSVVPQGGNVNNVVLDDGTMLSHNESILINMTYLYGIRNVPKRVQETAPIIRYTSQSSLVVPASITSDASVDTIIIKSPADPNKSIVITHLKPTIERVGDYFSNWAQTVWFEDRLKNKIVMKNDWELAIPMTISPGDSFMFIIKTNTNDKDLISQIRNNSIAYYRVNFCGDPDSAYITGNIGYQYSTNYGIRRSSAILRGYDVLGKKHEFSGAILQGDKSINDGVYFIDKMEWKGVTTTGATLRLKVKNFFTESEPVAIAIRLQKNRYESTERLFVGYGSFENEYLLPYALTNDLKYIDIPIYWNDFFLETFEEDTIYFTRFDVYDLDTSRCVKVQDLVYDGRAKTLVIKETDPVLSWKVAPNPITDHFNLITNLTRSLDVKLVIHDMVGRKIMETKTNLSAGESTTKISFPYAASGVYFVHIAVENKPFRDKQKTWKVTKLR